MPQEQEPRKKRQHPKTVQCENHIYRRQFPVVQELLKTLKKFPHLQKREVLNILELRLEEREFLILQEKESHPVRVFAGCHVLAHIATVLLEELLLPEDPPNPRCLHKFPKLLLQPLSVHV